jgi:hypothetical protein
MLKKYWKELALFVAIAIIFLLFQAWQNATDDKIAAQLTAQAEAKLRAKLLDISKQFALENYKLTEKYKAANADVSAANARADEYLSKSNAAQKEIKNLKTCNEQLQATNTELDICQKFVIKQKDDFNESIGELKGVFSEKMALKEKECAKRESVLTNEVGRVTKIASRYAVRSKRRIAVGPSVGYGVRGIYIGFGITYRLFEFGI